RVDKLAYAALEATLLAYARGDHESIPLLRMLRRSKEELQARAERVAADAQSAGLSIELIDGESLVGGGAAPSAVLPTCLLAVTCDGLSASELSSRLRSGEPPVITRVEEGRVLLDLRTVFPQEDVAVAEALRRA